MSTAKTKRPRLMIINEPDGRRFSKALAMEIGRDHAEIFLQIEYLISISSTPAKDDRIWTRQSIRSLQREHFPYWGTTFIYTILQALCNGYIHKSKNIPAILDVRQGGFYPGDQTAWYALNENGIATLTSVTLNKTVIDQAVHTKRTPRSPDEQGVRQTNGGVRQTNGVFARENIYISEIPSETPTEREDAPEKILISEEPPEVPPVDPSHFEKKQEVVTPNIILATRNVNPSVLSFVKKGS